MAESSLNRLTSTMAVGRKRPKFMSTIKSVPPASAIASGRLAFIARASSSVSGTSTSIGVRLLYPRRRCPEAPKQRLRAEDEVLVRGGLPRRVADPAHAGDEKHSGGNVTREDGGVVAGAAPHPGGLPSRLFAGLLERVHYGRVHWSRWHPGEKFHLGAAALLGADPVQPGGERVDRLPDDPLLEMADLERELGATGDDVDAARIEPHRSDVGHRLKVGRLHQVAQLAGGAGCRPSGVVPETERRGPRVVLGAEDLDSLAVHADDSGDHREVDPLGLHPSALLDVQLDEPLDRRPMLLGLDHPIDVAAGLRQDLTDGHALPIEPVAQSTEIQLADQGE